MVPVWTPPGGRQRNVLFAPGAAVGQNQIERRLLGIRLLLFNCLQVFALADGHVGFDGLTVDTVAAPLPGVPTRSPIGLWPRRRCVDGEVILVIQVHSALRTCAWASSTGFGTLHGTMALSLSLADGIGGRQRKNRFRWPGGLQHRLMLAMGLASSTALERPRVDLEQKCALLT